MEWLSKLLQPKNLNRIIACLVFLSSAVLFISTAQSSVAYWDCAEYAAVAPALEVPHPPGAPLFVLAGRLATLATFIHEPAFRINLVSALASAFTVTLLYLICARVVSVWEGTPESGGSRFVVYGGSAIGSLTLAVSDTFWFNAVESCLFASAIFFIALMLWLTLVWFEKWKEEGAMKYLLLTAYLLGLSSGIHQLCLLIFFPIALIVYFRYFEFGFLRLAKFVLAAVAGFGIVYPCIERGIVAALSGTIIAGPIKVENSPAVSLLPVALLIAVFLLLKSAIRRRNWLMAATFNAVLLVVLGYSTYALVYIRANAVPPINENNPSTFANLSSYLGRDQYGKQPAIWPRRWSSEPQYQPSYQKYSSDVEYFWKYQFEHMFLRYIGFNFIGRSGDEQDSSVEFLGTGLSQKAGSGYPAKYYAIPLLIGLFGLWYHFKRDWKFGLVFLTMFIMMGVALAVYFNMAEPQPRERDYFFVGAFFAFSLWIGVGSSGIIRMVAERAKPRMWRSAVPAFVATLVFTSVPLNMFKQNFFSHDRHNNYAARDMSYDILESCPENAVLFTGGDNDTFPLWYLQEALGVRTDVRIICLSLANTDWYLLQLKNETPHGAMKVPIGFSDSQIEQIAAAGALQWESRKMKLPVSRQDFEKFGVSDTAVSNKRSIDYTINPTLDFGGVHGLRVQDIMISNIVMSNNWNRPICFSTFTPPSDFDGLQEYFERIGLVYELTPIHSGTSYYDAVNVPLVRNCLLEPDRNDSPERKFEFTFKGLDKAGVYYDSNARNMVAALRDSFLSLGLYYESHGEIDSAKYTLREMDKKIPLKTLTMDFRMTEYISRLFYSLGDSSRFRKYADVAEAGASGVIESGRTGSDDAYGVLLNIYMMERSYTKALELLTKLQSAYPGDSGIASRIEELKRRISMTEMKKER